MTIDTSKIRPGDTGTIRATFYERSDDGTFWWVGVERPEGYAKGSLAIAPSAIASHTPAPWVPEPGDVITWGVAVAQFFVKATNGDFVWLVHSPDTVDEPVTKNWLKLENLTLIRKGAA